MRNQRVAKAIRGIRDSTGLSQWDFAHKFNIPMRALQNWEQGLTLPDFRGIARLLKVAGARAHLIFEAMGLYYDDIRGIYLDAQPKAPKKLPAKRSKEMEE